MPGWVKVFAIIALIVMVLFVALLIFGKGRHGPGRHFSSSAVMLTAMAQG
jgi:hypothetical protein